MLIEFAVEVNISYYNPRTRCYGIISITFKMIQQTLQKLVMGTFGETRKFKMGESISSSDELAQAEQFSARLGSAHELFRSA